MAPSENRGLTERHSGHYKPGQSGNPGGRPKAEHVISELARAHSELAIQTLVNVCRGWRLLDDLPADAPVASRGGERDYFPVTAGQQVSAAVALLDRGYGRPRQAVELSAPEGEDLSLRIEFIAAEQQVENPEDAPPAELDEVRAQHAAKRKDG